MIDAVVFDLDGVLLDSERLWDQSRREVVADQGGTWSDEATAAMQGMSSPEWARYLHEHLGVAAPEPRIVEMVLEKLLRHYETDLPLLPGARSAVERMAARWPLALASSSNRVVIDRVLRAAGMEQLFRVSVSSEEVDRGKPAPDVYLEAARRLRCEPWRCVAVEDSTNGIRSASAAAMTVVAVPNEDYPPNPAALSSAAAVIATLEDLTVGMLEQLAAGAGPADRRVDEVEDESFPASDPHSDWAGPPG